MLKLLPEKALLTLFLLCPLAHAADAPAAAGHYLILYAAPGVPQDDDPYTWSTVGGKQLTKGVTTADGRAYLTAEGGEKNYVLTTVSTRWQVTVAAQCWQGAPEAFQDCVQLGKTTSRYDEEQESVKLAAQEKEVKLQARIADYAAKARANDDALAWLGRLPANWTMESYGARLLSIGDKVAAQISRALKDGGPDPRQFVCRAPDHYGHVPYQAMVNAWIAAPSAERAMRSGPAWDGLVVAGAKGNWMARLELYYTLSNVNVSELSLLEQYRIVQLMEWLHNKQVGGLYSYFSAGMPAAAGNSGSDTWRMEEQATLYAAMLGSYDDQSSGGKILQANPDPVLAAAGSRMQACAEAYLQQRH